MTMYNDFLDRRLALEGGISDMSTAADRGALSSSVDGVAINGTPINNVPNISSPEAAAVIQNMPPAMTASAQSQAVTEATLESLIASQTAISFAQSSPIPLPTVQPADIAAAVTFTSAPPQVNLQIMPEGFGSYLDGILPKDLATAAGAFSASMQQIRNIRNVPIEQFAQVASTLELATVGLNLVNGTNVPTEITEAAKALKIMALGSGPYGTYTYSDFFGCMSGLPYPWAKIKPALIALQTDKLQVTYQQLYLAVTWLGATATCGITLGSEINHVVHVVPPLPDPPYDITYYNYFYSITSITVGSKGGGYYRANAPMPDITFVNDPSYTINTPPVAVATVGTDPYNLGTYGRVTKITITNPGKIYYGYDVTSPPSAPTAPPVVVQTPPTANFPYPYVTGVNTTGGTFSNPAVQSLIDDANAEIAVIRSVKPGKSMELNDMWDDIGTQLTIEQRARNLALRPPPLPNEPDTRDTYGDIYPYPIMLYSFTDLVPTYAKLTEPNMAVQTLEAISDLDKNSGQSIVAMMRAERNKARLIEAGITTDDSILDTLTPNQQVALIANGTVANSAPAFPFNIEPAGYFDPTTKNFVITSTDNITVQPTILGAPNSSVAAVLGIGTPDGLPIPSPDIGIGTDGISQVSLPEPTPFFTGPGAGGGLGAQGGGPIVPGSLSGSPYTKLIPPALNPIYTSGSLLPATLPVQAAIEQVILCNCDCWI